MPIDKDNNSNNNNHKLNGKNSNENDPFILAGCNIMEGSAYVLVCSVGVNT